MNFLSSENKHLYGCVDGDDLCFSKIILSCFENVDIWLSKPTPSQTQMIDSMHSSQFLRSKPAACLCEMIKYHLKAWKALELLELLIVEKVATPGGRSALEVPKLHWRNSTPNASCYI